MGFIGHPPGGDEGDRTAGTGGSRGLRRYRGAVPTTAPRRLAQLVALGRIGIGCTALVAPTLMTRPWIGGAAGSPEARLLARAMGGRDLALGVGTLRALGVDDAEARPWVALAGMADAVDATVTVLAFRRLPPLTRWVVLVSTVGAAVVSFRVAVALEPPWQPAPPAAGRTPPARTGPARATGPSPGAPVAWPHDVDPGHPRVRRAAHRSRGRPGRLGRPDGPDGAGGPDGPDPVGRGYEPMSVRGPALVVLGLAVVILLGGVVASAISSGSDPTFTIRHVTLSDGTDGDALARPPPSSGASSRTTSRPPTSWATSACRRSPSSCGVQSLDQGTAQFDRTVDLHTAALAQGQVVEAFRPPAPPGRLARHLPRARTPGHAGHRPRCWPSRAAATASTGRPAWSSPPPPRRCHPVLDRGAGDPRRQLTLVGAVPGR